MFGVCFERGARKEKRGGIDLIRVSEIQIAFGLNPTRSYCMNNSVNCTASNFEVVPVTGMNARRKKETNVRVGFIPLMNL